jgi:hypothetical protein
MSVNGQKLWDSRRPFDGNPHASRESFQGRFVHPDAHM